ncbi:hypothetical protein AVEN_262813-1 [Araneus ventricosus]|uniref:Uncharacterized protein n=1 Tax=Araneus ventricosus TaxID=182803 RepID=A0A4Y2WK02_ARAVE|nr:hypothetical protein AVEN_262813-1 [Araneus ventricosus]
MSEKSWNFRTILSCTIEHTLSEKITVLESLFREREKLYGTAHLVRNARTDVADFTTQGNFGERTSVGTQPLTSTTGVSLSLRLQQQVGHIISCLELRHYMVFVINSPAPHSNQSVLNLVLGAASYNGDCYQLPSLTKQQSDANLVLGCVKLITTVVIRLLRLQQQVGHIISCLELRHAYNGRSKTWSRKGRGIFSFVLPLFHLALVADYEGNKNLSTCGGPSLAQGPQVSCGLEDTFVGEYTRKLRRDRSRWLRHGKHTFH